MTFSKWPPQASRPQMIGAWSPVPHVFYVPLEGGTGNIEFIQKHFDRHDPPLVEHLVDLVESLCTVHGSAQDVMAQFLSHYSGIIPRAIRRRKMVAG